MQHATRLGRLDELRISKQATCIDERGGRTCPAAAFELRSANVQADDYRPAAART